jgi:16S rRNA (guanine527-N7)-methyltransferase
MSVEERFKNQVRALGRELTEQQEHMFSEYCELLLYWNDFMNLTSITDKEEIYEKHFLDSLSLVKVIDLESKQQLLDVGAGAGFPGIPLKIVFPHLQLVLLDSLEKKVYFLEQVVEELGLESVRCLHGRAEEKAREEDYRQSFSLVVSRAVADLAVLSEYALPFVKVGGDFVAYKSITSQEEVNSSSRAIEILGGKLEEDIVFDLPDTKLRRRMIRIKKVLNTPMEYPRRVGKPMKKPL